MGIFFVIRIAFLFDDVITKKQKKVFDVAKIKTMEISPHSTELQRSTQLNGNFKRPPKVRILRSLSRLKREKRTVERRDAS